MGFSNNPILIEWNKDDENNKYGRLKENEPHIVTNGFFTLNEIPDNFHKVVFTDRTMNEIKQNEALTEVNEFKVFYDGSKKVIVDKSLEGQLVHVTYYGLGLISYPSTCIYDIESGETISTTKSLQDFIDSIKIIGWQGEYDNKALYFPNAIVYYSQEKTIYRCIALSKGNAPSNTTYWQAMISVKEEAEYARQEGDYAKSQGNYAKIQGDYAKQQGDLTNQAITNANNATTQILNETLTIKKPYINTYSDIATTYPTPQNGWETVTKDTNTRYRYNGTLGQWIPTDVAPYDKIGDLSKISSTNLVDEIKSNTNKIGDLTGLLNDITINIEMFPRLVTETDDSARFTRTLNSLPSNGGTIIFPQGKTYTGTFTINRSNIKITGGGIIKGRINLYGTPTIGISRFDPSSTGDICIEGITIDGEKTRNGIHLKWVYGVTIKGITLKHCVKSIYFEPIPYTQHCSRITITDNRLWDCNYGLYVDYDETILDSVKFEVGDITYTNNTHESRNSGWDGTFGNIYHIWAKGLDGLICKGNTFFFSTTGSETTNIYLELFNWVQIEGNQLFQPPTHAIHAYNGQNLIAKNNNIAWSGKESILVDACTTVDVSHNNISFPDNNSVTVSKTGILVQNSPYFIGSISNNNIYFPNEYAIRIVSSSCININGNNARNKYSVNEPIRIDTLSTCGDINIVGNQFTAFPIKMENVIYAKGINSTIHYSANDEGTAGAVLNGVFSPTYRSYSGNEPTIDISNRSLIVFNNSSATTIITITSEDLTKALPRLITLYSYNGNTTISNSAANLKGGMNATIPTGESLTLMIYGGSIKEVQRSFSLANRTLTVSGTQTSLDATYYDQFNLNQSSTYTITSISGGTEGKVITIIGFSANTTISNSVGWLKGQVSVNIPNKATLRLLYTAGAWFEISRSF